MLRYSLALGITPSRVHLELLLQDHLLVAVLLGPTLRLVLLALILSGFFVLVFAFFLLRFRPTRILRNRLFDTSENRRTPLLFPLFP